jgi:hypothetical protein
LVSSFPKSGFLWKNAVARKISAKENLIYNYKLLALAIEEENFSGLDQLINSRKNDRLSF